MVVVVVWSECLNGEAELIHDQLVKHIHGIKHQHHRLVSWNVSSFWFLTLSQLYFRIFEEYCRWQSFAHVAKSVALLPWYETTMIVRWKWFKQISHKKKICQGTSREVCTGCIERTNNVKPARFCSHIYYKGYFSRKIIVENTSSGDDDSIICLSIRSGAVPDLPIIFEENMYLAPPQVMYQTWENIQYKFGPIRLMFDCLLLELKRGFSCQIWTALHLFSNR